MQIMMILGSNWLLDANYDDVWFKITSCCFFLSLLYFIIEVYWFMRPNTLFIVWFEIWLRWSHPLEHLMLECKISYWVYMILSSDYLVGYIVIIDP
jgi:hypothetical protein